MNINNFSGAIISAAAYTRLRDISASDADNVRHDDEGALVTRPGHRQLPAGNDTIVAIFAHWGYVLAVTAAGELKWETEAVLADAETGDDLFRSFIPARGGFDVEQPTDFLTDENVVFVSNANVQLKVVFWGAFFGVATDPDAYPFYLPEPGAYKVHERAVGESGDGHVYLRFQLIKTLSQDADHYEDYPIEAVGPSRLAVTTTGEEQVPNDQVFDIEITAGDIILNLDTDVDYIDVFQTLSTAENENAEYYFIARIPHQAGDYRISTKLDTAIETERTLVEPLDTPAWQIATRSNERLYLNSGNDNKIWMTYWESGEKYLRTVTDSLPVNTGGYPITGLKILQQNMLVVYTENRIFLLSVDPIAEQHRILEVITTKDDKDAPIGCVAPESIVDVNGYHYFLSSNRQVYRFGGQRVTWVSDTINPTLAKMPRALSKKAFGFARGLTYCLAYPSTPESIGNDAVLYYDTPRKLWWKDALGITAFSRGQSGAEYALIERYLSLLNTGTLDNGEQIHWLWRGNKVLLPLNTLIHSLFIGGLPEDIGTDSIELQVKLKTEEGEQTQTLMIESAVNFWEQIVGFNLRGRSVQVELSGIGRMKIDRLEFNPQP